VPLRPFLLGRVLPLLCVLLQFGAASAQPAPRQDEDPLGALRFRRLQLQDERGEIPPDARMRALAQAEALRAARPRFGYGATSAGISPDDWVWLGPASVGGRIRAIVVHPTNAHTLWIGSVGGGVWKSIDAGASWFPVSDPMANLAVSTLIIDPTNADVLYAGTGEGFGNIDAIRGAGIFKSTDGGGMWVRLPSTNTADFWYVNRIAISPDGATLLAATSTGIFRSADGGATWAHTSVAQPILDLAFSPGNPLEVVAGSWNLVRHSSDGGATWVDGVLTGGLSHPGALGGRVELAWGAGEHVYAAIDNNAGEVWKSTDAGAHYAVVTTSGVGYMGAQGWYDNAIWVDPTNENRLVVGGETSVRRSTNGGVTLVDITGVGIHPDYHAIVAGSGYDGVWARRAYFGTDGGIFKTENILSPSPLLSTDINNNLGITQFYSARGNVSGQVVGGTQDNGTLSHQVGDQAGAWTEWSLGGDGGDTAADLTDPDYFYGEYQFLGVFRSVNGAGQYSAQGILGGLADAGSAANFIAPLVLDPNSPNRLLAGGQSLWLTLNPKASTPSAVTWSAIKAPVDGNSNISAIAVQPGNSNRIWVGHNSGAVYRTLNGATATPTWTFAGTGLPARMVTSLAAVNSGTAYATFGGFSSDNVWRTTNGGASWNSIHRNLPSAPIYSLVVGPTNPSWLYVGTEVGIFASEDGGVTWSAQDGPVNACVQELSWIGYATLLAATHGCGLWEVTLAGAAATDPAASPAFALAGARPNPATRELRVAFSLSSDTPARLELLDVAGRELASRDVGALGPGHHALELTESRALPAGFYLLRLTQSGRSLTQRAVIVR